MVGKNGGGCINKWDQDKAEILERARVYSMSVASCLYGVNR